MANKGRKTARIVSYLEFSIAAGIVVFWTSFYSFGWKDLPEPGLKDIYLAFEGSFPPADALLALFLICGGIGLRKMKASGWLFTLMAGAMLVFLGLLDVSFNSRQGIYLLGPGEAVLNMSVNATCLAGGGFLIWSGWRNALRRLPLRAEGASDND
jgi:hypothetical protein